MLVITLTSPQYSNELIEAHKKACYKQGYPVQYIETKLPHADAMMAVLNLFSEAQILFLDLDCIPLLPITDFLALVSKHNEPGIIAPRQCANHKPQRIDYGGLFFWYINRHKLPSGFPYTLLEDASFDVGGRFWHSFPKEEKVMIPFISCDTPKWDFSDGAQFGNGSIYGFDGIPMLYHQFEIRNGGENENIFKEKCTYYVNK